MTITPSDADKQRTRASSKPGRSARRTSVFYRLALIGFFVSAAVHLLTFAGISVPGALLLHFGVFVVWVPTVLALGKMAEKARGFAVLRSVARHAPRWMVLLTLALFFIYVPFNFLYTLFVLNEGGFPARFDGTPVLHSGGRIIRRLSEEEFQWHRAYRERMASGHWMVFYVMAATVLHARLYGDLPERQRRGADEG